jgi:hypothetical protein
MLFTLLIICIIIFILYNFYIDYRDWSNVGGDFAEGMANNVCMTEEECKKVAESLGLKLGGNGYPFAGNWGIKGLYAYKSGKYNGIAFFGTGGTEKQMKDPLTNNTNIYRPIPPSNSIEEETYIKEKPQDNNSIVLIDDNFKKPIRNNVIDIKDFKMGKDYELEFTIVPLGKKWGWSNILHNTFTNKNCCRVGDRYPAIWFRSNTTKMHIICGAKSSNNWNTGDDPNYQLPINKESTVNIRLQNNIFSVLITDQNGNIVYSRNKAVNKTTPPKYIIQETPKFYFSDPWHRSANVKIKNMTIINLDPKTVDETKELIDELRADNTNNMNSVNKQLLDSIIKNKESSMSMMEKMKLIKTLQQQNQLPRQVIQILQPPRQIYEAMGNGNGIANSINSLNTGDQMLQSVPSNINLQEQSIPRISEFTLFNEDIMAKILSNKNLIPNDIKVGMENKENFIRIGKNFMIEVSKIRNLALPNIDQDDYEKIGRITSRIYVKTNNNSSNASIKVNENSLIKIINNILNGSDGEELQSGDPTLRNPNQPTGMFSNNGNRHLSTENTQESDNQYQNRRLSILSNKNTKKMLRLSKEDLSGSLCMWEGCQKGGSQPIDSIYSIF